MRLPFTLEQFLATFREYNEAIDVAPLALTFLAVGLVALAHSRLALRHRLISAGLAALWLWSGVVYHLEFFSRINPAARVFGVFFVGQAALLLILGAIRGRILFSPRESIARFAGTALIGYALMVYPLLGWMQGHGYPDGPSFGAPCPMTIYFIGMLLWSTGRIPAGLAVIPLLWAFVGSVAAVQLGIREDLALVLAALLLIAFMAHGRMRGFTDTMRRPLPHT